MNILVTDRKSIEDGILVRTSYIVISIRDPGKMKAAVRKTSGLRATLFLQFHDTEPTKGMILPPEIRLMSPKDAASIWAFVLKHSKNVGTIVVHCEQGMSRSPAIAAAICKGLGGDDQRFWREYQPNRYVYDLVVGASGKGH
jgi:predicted protein tyrosine phosphatase